MRHPLFNALVRRAARRELEKRGYTDQNIDDMLACATSDVIADAQAKAGVEMGAIGDGTILNAIIEFLKSPAGQALIQALIALLLGQI